MAGAIFGGTILFPGLAGSLIGRLWGAAIARKTGVSKRDAYVSSCSFFKIGLVVGMSVLRVSGLGYKNLDPKNSIAIAP